MSSRKKLLFFICFRQQASSVKQELFYVDGQHNTKISVLKNDSLDTSTTGKKSVRKYTSGNILLIPTNDETEASQVMKVKYLEIRLLIDGF